VGDPATPAQNPINRGIILGPDRHRTQRDQRRGRRRSLGRRRQARELRAGRVARRVGRHLGRAGQERLQEAAPQLQTRPPFVAAQRFLLGIESRKQSQQALPQRGRVLVLAAIKVAPGPDFSTVRLAPPSLSTANAPHSPRFRSQSTSAIRT
jgi:hypothetical protein